MTKQEITVQPATAPLRVLIVEDERLIAEELRDRLTRLGFEAVGVADNFEAAILSVQQQSPDLVMLDVRLRGARDGIDVGAAIRATQPDASLIYLTALSDDTHLNRAKLTDPVGYLFKPFDERHLRAALALAEGRRRLADEAVRDALTGCWNRRGLVDILARVGRQPRALGLLMIDLDNFKPINDTYGHSTGDAVLIDVVGHIRRSVRPYDSVVRYGGDEFVIVLPDTDVARATEIAERIRVAINAQRVVVAGAVHVVSVTVGSACTERADQIASHDLINAADTSLYAAKRAGRNRVGNAASVSSH